VGGGALEEEEEEEEMVEVEEEEGDAEEAEGWRFSVGKIVLEELAGPRSGKQLRMP
jgi:hypothetical protein